MRTRLLLQLAWVSGAFAFIWFFINNPEYGLLSHVQDFSANHIGGATYEIAALAMWVVYMNGFAVLGILYKDRYITHAAHWYIMITTLSVTMYFAALYYGMTTWAFFEVAQYALGIVATVAMAILGWSVLNLKKNLGSLAVWYGCITLLSAIGIGYLYLPLAFIFNSTLFVIGTIILFRLSPKAKN